MQSTTPTGRFEVFLHMHYVRRRNYSVMYGDRGYRAQWIVRGISSKAYESKTCNTPEQAEKLAHAWLAKHSDRYVDTTKR